MTPSHNVEDDPRSPVEHLRHFEGMGGLTLAASSWGNPSDPPVVLLHGGGQTRHSWGGTGQTLARTGLYAVALDTRGHGESGWAPDGDYSWSTLAGDLEAVCRLFESPPALVGASAGGLISLAAVGSGALTPVALVLVDIVLRMEPEGVRRIRAFMHARPDGFDSLQEAADAVADFLPDRPRPVDLSGLAKNLRRGHDGRLRWHWDPRWLEAGNGHTAAIAGLAEYARRIVAPTLVIRGRSSDVVGSEGLREFRSLVPHAEYVDVEGAGHMVAGDRNDAFTDAVVSFLLRVVRGA